MAPSQPSILIALLRNDLRIADHEIWHEAHHGNLSSRVTHVLPCYVFDERQIELKGIKGYQKAMNREARTRVGKFWKCNVHRTRFLHESLVDLDENLRNRGSGLKVMYGRPEIAIPSLVKAFQDKGVRVEGVWLAKENASEEIQVEEKLGSALQKVDSTLHLTENRRTLILPGDLPFDSASKDMPDVYTHFRTKVEGLGDKMVRAPLPAPEKFKPLPEHVEVTSKPGALPASGDTGLEQVLPQLLEPLQAEDHERSPQKSNIPYKGGLTAGEARLMHFTEGPKAPLATYKETRNGLLGMDFSSKFSPWLANGTLSPRTIFEAVERHEEQYGASKNTYWIKFELLWRDFFSFLIEKHGNKFFHLSGLGLGQQEPPSDRGNPMKAPAHAKARNGRKTLDGYWLENDWDRGEDSDVQKWCYGCTGVPFIDANMRELKETGYMSNRGRQNVASFFTRDMGHQDWRLGSEWFESYLLDYDITSNWGNWQYQSGCGTDPRSARQFNIVKQGKDYDAKAEYISYWLPELAEVGRKHGVPVEQLHHPWTVESMKSDLEKNDKLKCFASKQYEQRSWAKHYARKNDTGNRNGIHVGKVKGHGKGPGGGKQKEQQQEQNRQRQTNGA